MPYVNIDDCSECNQCTRQFADNSTIDNVIVRWRCDKKNKQIGLEENKIIPQVPKWCPKILKVEPLPYEKEINEIMNALHESWMDKNEKSEFNKQMFELTSKEKLSKLLQEGVDNGYPIEMQIELCPSIIKMAPELEKIKNGIRRQK